MTINTKKTSCKIVHSVSFPLGSLERVCSKDLSRASHQLFLLEGTENE